MHKVHLKSIILFEYFIFRISERSKLGDLIKSVLARIDVDVKEDEISTYKTAQIKDLKILLKCEYVQPYGKMNLKRYVSFYRNFDTLPI